MGRLATSRFGKLVLSAFAISLFAAELVQNLPDGSVRQRLSGLDPYAAALGVDQNWSVFSDPYSINVIVVARIRYVDGSTGRWTVPSTGPLVGAYWDYRWRKWEEQLRKDDDSGLWQPAAEYVAGYERDRGRDPVSVTLVRRWYDLYPPGPGPDRGPWQHYAFYTLNLAGGGQR